MFLKSYDLRLPESCKLSIWADVSKGIQSIKVIPKGTPFCQSRDGRPCKLPWNQLSIWILWGQQWRA